MKNKLTKILITAIATITTSTFLAGCGSQEKASTANAVTASEETTETSDSNVPEDNTESDDTSTQTEKKGVLKVGTEGNWYPFNFIDENDELAGFDIDVVNAVADKLGYDVEFEITDFDILLTSVDAGKLDLASSGIAYSDERAEKYVYANVSYNSIDDYLVVAADSDIQDISELQDVHISAGDATTKMGKYWIDYAESHPEQNLILDKLNGTPYDEVNVEAIKNGSIAAFINTKVAIKEVNKSFGEVYKIVGDPVISDKTYQIFKKGNEDLRDEWDKALQELIDDGTIPALKEKWSA